MGDEDPASKRQKVEDKFLVFQLGTNNWQREGEFAPGSGILHEAHHRTMNATPGVVCYSIYPSQNQTQHDDPQIRVFKLEHPIPICESVSPVSNYRWHSMSDAEFDAYKSRLESEVYEHMNRAEEAEGVPIRLAIAHHSFLNPLVLKNVIAKRKSEGKSTPRLGCFVHGTALKMYVHEKEQKNPVEFPLRFLPILQREKVFDSPGEGGVEICYAISKEQIGALRSIFPNFPADRVCISPNGINQMIFHEIDGLSLRKKLCDFTTVPYEGSKHAPAKIDGSQYDKAVIMVSKFADWKRVPALLHAAKKYESELPRVATLIVGSGPSESQKELQDLAFEELQLKHTYFLGPHPQPVLAELYTIASVGVFPSYKEPFGMVFVECMACGTPTIGAASGGPLDFVDDKVGLLIPEPENRYDWDQLGAALYEGITDAIKNDWKSRRASDCKDLVDKRFSVKKQVTELLDGTRKVLEI